MALTAAQADAFRTAVKADVDSAVVSAYAAKDSHAIAVNYNTASNTSIWRNDLKIEELIAGVDWIDFSTLTPTGSATIAAAQQSFFGILATTTGGRVDATNAKIRAGFSHIFNGKTTLTTLTGVAQRLATKYEALAAFITAAAPANVSSVIGYRLTDTDVHDALWDGSGNPL